MTRNPTTALTTDRRVPQQPLLPGQHWRPRAGALGKFISRSAMALAALVAVEVAALDDAAYRWRNDDGSESTATWKANADTPIVGVTREANFRLRFAVVGAWGPDRFASTASVEYSESLWGPWTAVPLGAGGPFRITATTGYANGEAATAQLPLPKTFVGGGCVAYPGNTVALPLFAETQYINFEYCFQATAYAKRNTTYYFRPVISFETSPGHPNGIVAQSYAPLTIEDADPAVPVTEIIVDDADPNTLQTGEVLTPQMSAEIRSGQVSPWWPSANTAGAWNGGSLISIDAFEANVLAFRWIPEVPVAGAYRVYARWTSGAQRGRHIPYTIRHAGGDAEVVVNQRDPALGGQWNLLGTYTFNQGTDGWIELGGNDGQACADAVRLVAADVKLLTDRAAVTVPEGGTVDFRVRLSAEPTGSVAVAVARTAGDADLTVAGGASLTFTPANWNVYQPVTLAAAMDADNLNGTATITGSAAGLTSVNVAATEQDKDANSGGTVVEYTLDGTRYRAHVFTAVGSSTFTVKAGDAHVLEYLIVGGGGGGGSGFWSPIGSGIVDLSGGGGGAGGLIANVGGTPLSVTDGDYTIVVGGGGAGVWPGGAGGNGVNGEASSAFGLTALGGGGGAGKTAAGTTTGDGLAGGSGGGGREVGYGDVVTSTAGGAGQQPGSPAGGFGNMGGSVSYSGGSSSTSSGGGGGAGGPGQVAPDYSVDNGAGGVGLAFDITGSTVVYATGGEGRGSRGNSDSPDATANRGNGGRGTEGDRFLNGSGKGGSGIVVIRYAIGGGGNNPPVIVSAAWADANPVTLPAGTTVHVVASDPDGDALTYAWTKVSGAGTATLAAPAAADSGVTFSAAGTYVLRVTVADGKGGSVASDVSVTVNAGSDVDPRADCNHDGVVNALDLQIVIANFGKTVP